MVFETGSSKMDQMGSFVKKALVQAKIEKRLVVGLSQIVKFLKQGHNEVPIICLMALPNLGDYATHMHKVLLQAYCLENGICIIQVDSKARLNRILNLEKSEESCVLISVNASGDSDCEGSFLDQDYQMTKFERKLVDYCEHHWNDVHATIRLPEK